jgi:proteic killer suppression protein
VIGSFADKDTERLWGRQPAARFRAFERIALRKLAQLDAATSLEDLKHPPGNRLEALRGNRKGQMSLRINDQWRICFEWCDGRPERVEIVDYH